MDRRHLSLVRESEVRFDLLIPAEAEAAMLVEFEGDEPQEMRDQMRGLIEGVQQQARLAFGSRQAFDQEETELFLNLPNRAMPLSIGSRARAAPCPWSRTFRSRPMFFPISWCERRTCSNAGRSRRRCFATLAMGSCTSSRFSIWTTPATCSGCG